MMLKRQRNIPKITHNQFDKLDEDSNALRINNVETLKLSHNQLIQQ